MRSSARNIELAERYSRVLRRYELALSTMKPEQLEKHIMMLHILGLLIVKQRIINNCDSVKKYY